MVTKNYLPSNLCDSSDGNDSSYSSDSGDSSDSSHSIDISDSSESSDKKKTCSPKKCSFFHLKISKTHIVMKVKNSNCDETQN